MAGQQLQTSQLASGQGEIIFTISAGLVRKACGEKSDICCADFQYKIDQHLFIHRPFSQHSVLWFGIIKGFIFFNKCE